MRRRWPGIVDERLREQCGRSEASDRLIRALRKLVDAIPIGSSRDELARELAQTGRGLDAARTVIHALDRMSPAACRVRKETKYRP